MFAHTDAAVSRQYLTVCARHGWKANDLLAIGTELLVSKSYFHEASSCFLEMSLKFGQVLWRKTAVADHEEADTQLIGVTLEWIKRGRYELARDLLHDFLYVIPPGRRSEQHRKIMILNLAQCHKWLGDTEKCLKILEDTDWLSASEQFRLANAVLRDDFDLATRHLRAAVYSGAIKKRDIETLPIFRVYRESQQFLAATGIFDVVEDRER